MINIAGQVEFNEVFLTDVRMPDLHRISPVGEGWGASITTLGAERLVLSGTRKKRRAKDEILGGKTIDEVLQLARRFGRDRGPDVAATDRCRVDQGPFAAAHCVTSAG